MTTPRVADDPHHPNGDTSTDADDDPGDLSSSLSSDVDTGVAIDPSAVHLGEFQFVPITPALLRDPVLLRALAGLVVGLVIIFWPARTDSVLAILVGLTFIWLSAISGVQSITGARRRRHLFVSLGGMLVGATLVLNVREAQENLGQLIGVTMIVIAIRDRPRRKDDHRRELLARSSAYATAGLVLVVFPNEVMAVATTVVVLAWIVLSAITIAAVLDARTPEAASYSSSVSTIAVWLDGLSKSVNTRRELAERLTFTGPEGHNRVIRFLILMFFASVIASMGVITDSTAVVIGAMLIAPLMTPLMGMAMSLGMGWPHRLGRAALIAGCGVLLAIAIGVLLGFIAPTVIDTTVNTQILSRSQPNVLDLTIAVAAGGAGAYGLSRPDVSDALPGVAIAISLVPPLAVVGIAYSQGDLAAGSGAMLLFGTNALAILLVGGATFIATGVVPLRRVAESQQRVTTSLAAVVALAAMVVGALLLNGQQSATDLLYQSRIEGTVDEWLTNSEHRILNVDSHQENVVVDVIGPRVGLPDVDDLADRISDAVGREMTADVRLTVEQTFSSSAVSTAATPDD